MTAEEKDKGRFEGMEIKKRERGLKKGAERPGGAKCRTTSMRKRRKQEMYEEHEGYGKWQKKERLE